MHCDGPVSGFPAVSEYRVVKDLTNVSRLRRREQSGDRTTERVRSKRLRLLV